MRNDEHGRTALAASNLNRCALLCIRPRRARFIGVLLAGSILLLSAMAGAVCVGDCNASGDVTVDEIVRIVGIALGQSDLSVCASADRDGNGDVTIDEIVAAVGYALGSCPVPTPTPIPDAPCPQRNPLRNVYFGDLHVHTTLSFDANLWDTRTTPADAYRFARGATLLLPPLDAQGNGTRPARLERPLDFAAVTDHSEFLGEIETCTTPGSPTYDSPGCQMFRAGGDTVFANFGIKMTQSHPRRFADVCGSDGAVCLAAAGTVWQRVQDAAAAAYDPCNFTSFVAYEYSRSPAASTMHRNVIFRSDHVVFPISAFEETTPQGLWTELRNQCVNAGNGCDVLAIPHNSNESNGRAFFVEYPGATTDDEQRAQARLRQQMEPLVEVYQHKASSECMNGLSGVVGAADEQCDFEKRRQGDVIDCRDTKGQLGATGNGCVSRLDFVRGVLLAGLQEQQRLGVNPYRLGLIGSTDTHNGTPGNTEESTFAGHQGNNDAAPRDLLGSGNLGDGGAIFSPGGLVGVWAEQNSRSSLFDALRRREVFATSGTRLSVRVFSGWDLPADLCNNANLVGIADAHGVPMGGVLPARLTGTGAPSFVVSALRDPGTDEHPGTALQRMQIVKGWLENGAAHQQVYDIAGSVDDASGVDLDTCITHGPGHDSLCSQWSDPSFDPAQPAFYYVRVLENPTCRWSTWVCNRLAPTDRPPACSSPTLPKTIQERAWTSPIWYEP
ncbi:MAG: DUF3604 domain-containing protein [Deltaproteobacteria bacterium]|nr:DUF3604 domain-containing protein [Deltaproteobacteria bacterium]